MEQKTTVEKLKVLLPHWVDHNSNHQVEFKKWADAARADGDAGLAGLLDKAVANMAATDEVLKALMISLGLPSEGIHSHHDSSHHHHHHH